MREIKFRGKSMFTGEWVQGDLLHFNNSTCIREAIGTIEDVRKETVGQYTGLKDKNGKEIFEGDVVKSELGNIGIVEFHHGQFVVRQSKLRWHSLNNHMPCKIIGNIHDNQELLEVQE